MSVNFVSLSDTDSTLIPIARSPRSPQASTVLAAHRRAGVSLTRSALEDRFLALLDRAGLPPPRTNAIVEGYEVDAFWRDQRLVVELDGYAFQHTRTAFQRDREKSNELMLRGWAVLRFTHRDVTSRPDRVAAAVRAALTAERLQDWR
jgi:very-short-patch-repair endonuclease